MDAAKQALLFGEHPLAIDVDDPEQRDQWLRRDLGRLAGPGMPWRAIQIVVRQIVDGRPAEVWRAARRLSGLGLSRHAVIENLAMAVMTADRSTLDGHPADRLRAGALDPPELPPDPELEGLPGVLQRLPVPSPDVLEATLRATTRDHQPIVTGTLLREALERLGRPSDGGLTLVAANRALLRAVLTDGPLALVGDGSVVEPSSLISDIVLTVRIRSVDWPTRSMGLDTDLAGFRRLGPHVSVSIGDTWIGSGKVERSAHGKATLQLPDGATSASHLGGEQIVVRLSGGHLSIEPVDGPLAIPADDASRVRRVYDAEEARSGLPVTYEDLVLGLLAFDRHWFDQPRAPLTELCRAANLFSDHGSLAHDRSVWENEHRLLLSARISRNVAREADERDVFAVLSCTPGRSSRSELRQALSALSSPAVAAVVAQELLDDRVSRTMAARVRRVPVQQMAETLLAMAKSRTEQAIARWLQALASELRGDPEQAEECLRLARYADPDWPPATDRLAWYRSDRGDGAVQPALLPDRAARLHAKAAAFLRWRGAAARGDLRRAAGEYLAPGAAGTDGVAGVDDPLVVDVTLHELGWFERFRRERGPLLPTEERGLARTWQGIARSLYRVEDTGADEIRLVDLRTAGEVVVSGSPPEGRWRAGFVLCARILPDGRSNRMPCPPFAVPTGLVDPFFDALDRRDAPGIVQLSLRSQPDPELLTSEMEPLVECLAVLAVPDPRRVREVLDDHYRRGGPGLWVEEHELEDGRTVPRARLRLRETRLRVDARSEARLDRVLGWLAEELPEVSVIWDRRAPVAASRRSTVAP